MNFNSVYNWLRFTSNPPSYLFKNRLFVEKNSRKLNIFNDLGKTYTSAKWGVSSTNTVSSNDVYKYSRNFALLLFIVLVVTYTSYDNLVFNNSTIVTLAQFTVWKLYDYIMFVLINLSFLVFAVIKLSAMWLTSSTIPSYESKPKNNGSKLKYPTTVLTKDYLYKTNNFYHLNSLFNSDTTVSKESELLKKGYKLSYYLNKEKLGSNLISIGGLKKVGLLESNLGGSNKEKKTSKWSLGELSGNVLPYFVYKSSLSNSSKVEYFFSNSKLNGYFKNLSYFRWLSKYSPISTNTLRSIDSGTSKLSNMVMGSTNSLELLVNNESKINSLSSDQGGYGIESNLLKDPRVLKSKDYVSSISSINESTKWHMKRFSLLNGINFNSFLLKMGKTSKNSNKEVCELGNYLIKPVTYINDTSYSGIGSTNRTVYNIKKTEYINNFDKKVINHTLSTNSTNTKSVKFFNLNGGIEVELGNTNRSVNISYLYRKNVNSSLKESTELFF